MHTKLPNSSVVYIKLNRQATGNMTAALFVDGDLRAPYSLGNLYLNMHMETPAQKLKRGHYISTQFISGPFYMYLKNKKKTKASAVWIDDFYEIYSHFQKESLANFKRKLDERYCAELTSRRGLKNTKFLIFFFIKPQENMILLERRSWQNSSDHCRAYGTFLPYFHSRDELEEVLALLKLHRGIAPTQSIFIGLQTNPRRQVRFPIFCLNFCGQVLCFGQLYDLGLLYFCVL